MNNDFRLRIENLEKILTPNIINPNLKVGTNDCIGCHHKNKMSIYKSNGVFKVKCWRPSCYLNRSISLIQLKSYMQNINYTTSLICLEKELHINIEDNNKHLLKRSSILNKCLEVYEHYLWHNEYGKKAIEYLYSRGFNKEVIKSKRLGFAPHKHCLSWFDINKEELNKQGLINANNVEYFINRIIFPIFDTNNNLVHFTGRYLDSSIVNNINNNFCPRYKDSKSVYNIPNIKDFLIFEDKLSDYITSDINSTLYICEGYPDSLTLAQYGFNVVGLLGIEKLNNHYHKLKHFKNLIFLFDNDCYYDFLLEKEVSKSYSRMIPQLVKLQSQLPEVNIKIFCIPKEEKVKDINDLFIKALKKKEVEVIINKIKNESIDFLDFYIDSEGENLNNHIEIIKLIKISKNKNNSLNRLKKFVQYSDPLKYVVEIVS